MSTAAHLARRMLAPDLLDRVRSLDLPDDGHGWDRFGLNRDWVALALALTGPLYRRYFRVTTHGIENADAVSQAVFAANHSGTIPLDAMMIWNDLIRQGNPPKLARVVVDHFVNSLPVVNVLFTRAGAIGGSRGNFHEVLSGGESILVFPEGVPGIGKPFSDRYQLQTWREGHVELAIRHQVPVVPVAVIGAEEQLPQIGRIHGIPAFGSPYLPITATPVPLPVHYHIWYGTPIRFDNPPSDADNPDLLRDAARTVKEAVQALIFEGLAARSGVFG